ncbi:hypothetical protein [Hydrogenophaga sp.]|uniref:hypothetical protein n=1 Tax=Hydrogenophaga sp. TaxID=1904254 RepID=UPI003F70967E
MATTFRQAARLVAGTAATGALLQDLRRVPGDLAEASRFNREAKLAMASARQTHPHHALLLHGYGGQSGLAQRQGRLDPQDRSGLYFMPAADWTSPLISAGYARGGFVALFRGPALPLQRAHAARPAHMANEGLPCIEGASDAEATASAHYASNPAGNLYLLPAGLAQSRLEPLAVLEAPRFRSQSLTLLHRAAARSFSADPGEETLTRSMPARGSSANRAGAEL